MWTTLHDTWMALGSAHVGWVAVAFCLYVLAIMAGGARWQLVLRSVGGRLGYPYAALATLAAVFVNNVTPTSRLAGEACRIAITRLKGRVSLPLGALASLGDRLADVVPLLVVGATALPVVRPLVEAHLAAGLAAVAAGVLVLAAVAPRLRTALRSWIVSRQRELDAAPVSRRVAGAVLAWSFAVWVMDVLRLMAVGLAFDVSLSWPQAAALMVVMVLGGLAPTIGGLGVVEGGLVGGLVVFGLPLEQAIAVTAVERAISYGFSTVAGGVVVLVLGGRRLFGAARAAGAGGPDDAAGRQSGP